MLIFVLTDVGGRRSHSLFDGLVRRADSLVNLVHTLELNEVVLKQVRVTLHLLLITQRVVDLVLENLLLERVGVDRLALVVREDHLHLSLAGSDKLVLARSCLLEASGVLLLHA